MISYNFRLEDENPAHVTVGVFAGRRPGSRGKCGTLKMEPQEWAELEAILGSGAVACGAVVEFTQLERAEPYLLGTNGARL